MKISVGKKLYLGFFSILIFLLIIGGTSSYFLKSINDEYDFLIEDRLDKVSAIKDLMYIQKDLSSDLRGYILYNDESYLQKIEENTFSLEEEYNQLKKKIVEPDEATLLVQQMEYQHHDYLTMIDQAISRNKSGDTELAIEAAQLANIYASSFDLQANKLIDLQNNLVSSTQKELEQNVSFSIILVIFIILISVLLSLLIAYFTSRSITKPLYLVTDALHNIASGNLQIEPIRVKNRDEIGEMVSSVNEMTNDLRSVLRSVNDSALEVASQAQQLSASSEESAAATQMISQLAEQNTAGSETQLRLVNDATTRTRELSQGITVIAKDSEEMRQTTTAVNEKIQTGSSAVHTVSSQMNDINQSIQETSNFIKRLGSHSDEISNITDIITGIADQTNLLALNAAIEAARAGEHGKGFAVVAEEVRKLAEQSKRSSVQIATMIESIQKEIINAVSSTDKGKQKVELGLSSSNAAREAFLRIEESISVVNERVQNVTIGTVEIQSVVTDIVNTIEHVQAIVQEGLNAVQEASAATEEQSATVEQIAASSTSLANLSEQLQNSINIFKV